MKQKLHYLFTLVSLLAVATAWAKDFTGGELYTLQEVQYGKFEARMMMAAASGTVSSMFLYQNGSEIADGRPWVEVDIEILGKNPNSFQSNIITGKAGAQKTSEKHHTISPAADLAFHTYAINGDGTHGGFISCTANSSTTNFTNCVFDGSIVSASGKTTHSCGGDLTRGQIRVLTT